MSPRKGIFDQPPNLSPPRGAPPCEVKTPFTIVSKSPTNELSSAENAESDIVEQKKFMPPAQPVLGKNYPDLAKESPLDTPTQKIALEHRVPTPTAGLSQSAHSPLEQKPFYLPSSKPPGVYASGPEIESEAPAEEIPPVQEPDQSEPEIESFIILENTPKIISQADTWGSVVTAQESPKINQPLLQEIFGAPHEMTAHEVWERCKKLPQIRKIEILTPSEISDDKGMIEFIQEGGITLAVTTNGGFARGVRETLIIVAREFGTALI